MEAMENILKSVEEAHANGRLDKDAADALKACLGNFGNLAIVKDEWRLLTSGLSRLLKDTPPEKHTAVTQWLEQQGLINKAAISAAKRISNPVDKRHFRGPRLKVSEVTGEADKQEADKGDGWAEFSKYASPGSRKR